MKAWSLFYPEVLPELPKVPVPLVDYWLRTAAIEFCERSKCHLVGLASLDSVANQGSYVIALAADTDLVELAAVRYQGETLDPVSPTFLETSYDDWESEVGCPEFYTQPDPSTVTLVPAPDASVAAAIRLRAAIKPGTAATGVDDWLFTKYHTQIAAGAKSKLMAMVSKPWSNPDEAPKQQTIFADGIDEAVVVSQRGFVRSRPRVTARFF